MNWYRKSQVQEMSKLPKGWKVTVKKNRQGLYEANLWFEGRYVTMVPAAFDTAQKAREGAVAWIDWQLNHPNGY
jgi:uncharacterized protein YbdZ (MbtH family)